MICGSEPKSAENFTNGTSRPGRGHLGKRVAGVGTEPDVLQSRPKGIRELRSGRRSDRYWDRCSPTR